MNEEKRINFSNKKIIILLVLVVLLLVGATLAASVLSVFNGNYVYKTACFDITYDTGQDITGTMFPSKNDKGGLDGDVSIGIDPTCNVTAIGDLYLNVDSSTSNKFIEIVTPHCENKYTLETLLDYTTSDACNTSDNGIWVDNGTALKYSVYDTNDLNKPVSVGYVDKIGESINIYSNFTLKKSTSYTIYIWLDGELADNSYSDLSFSANISATAEQVFKYIEEPVLDDGMIPVVISDNGVVTTISEDDLNWYDYNNQKWANIVLVNENATDSIDGSKSREYYLNNPGTTVLESDILAYYVWIPRYKYKIWTTGVSSTGNEQEIDIQFEFRNEDFSNGLNVGEYRTHPAFWFDDNNDGIIQNNEKLSGIWVGKFETTGTADKPTVLSNAKSLTGKIISSQFNTSLKFAGGVMDTSTGDVTFSGSDTYGLTAGTDSHMMKNSEWGAVAYLSHSKYGINSEIRNNNYNNSGTLTGCGASTLNANESTTCGIIYGVPSNEKNSYPQSTTGNISGVFDMSGGGWEYVMGNYNSTKGSSGFSVFPESKYYDKYTVTAIGSCTIDSCGGHALFETEGWYSDRVNFITSSEPWFLRGAGYSASSHNPGSYAYYYESGGTTTSVRAFRSVLIPYEYIDVTFDATGGAIPSITSYVNPGEYIYNVPVDGNYRLEVWGASGGENSGFVSGYGGYSTGLLSLERNSKLYVNVGGGGIVSNASSTFTFGGYNGGGSANYGAGTGGGATHIATVDGELSNLSSKIDNVLIVAGGGGGTGIFSSSNFGGSGGGMIGVDGGDYSSEWLGGGGGGTQTAGGTIGSGTTAGIVGSFGQGGNGGYSADNSQGSGGGGGGFYGGGGGSSRDGGGGGGSGYIGNSLLTDKLMYCYECTTSSDVDTLTYSTTSVSDNPISNNAKSGNGAARITLVDGEYFNKMVFSGDVYGELPISEKARYIFSGWYTDPEGGVLVTEDTIVRLNSSHTLYARWEDAPQYTVSYDANGGSGAPDNQIKYYGETLTLSSTVPTRTDYVFVGWSNAESCSTATSAIYAAGGEYTSNASVTLCAVWVDKNYNVNLNANGGNFISNVSYTSVGEHTYTVPFTGEYKLEVWGAQGGTYNSTYIGGYGGYSVGTVNLNNNDVLYVNVGGNGISGKSGVLSGGYNGGGAGYGSTCGNDRYGASGGGATHISTLSGELFTLSSSLSDILIVAGGGGGSHYMNSAYGSGASGGGTSGATANWINIDHTYYVYATGGNQISGGTNGYSFSSSSNGSNSSFGLGSSWNGWSCSEGSGGGGGYYGGGSGEFSPGGGGSGYIGNDLLTDKAMYCYNCTTSSSTSTLTYSTTSVSSTPTANYAKSGDGAARITASNISLQVTNGEIYGSLPTPTKEGYNFLGWYTELTGGTKVNNDTVVSIVGEHTLYARWEIITYTISYNANGGSGAPSNQTKTRDVTLTLSSTVPTRSGYAFLGWSTSSSATSATYSAGGSYTANADVTLYAVWEKRKYLYNLGDECSSVSGGWSQVSRRSSYYTNGSFTKGSNYLQLYSGGAKFTTVISNSKVSLSGYTKLNYVVSSVTSTSSGGWINAGLKTGRVAESDYYAKKFGMGSSGVMSLDISGYSSGSYYIDMTVANDSTSGYVNLVVTSIYLS